MTPSQESDRAALHEAVRGLMRYFESLVPVPHERRRHARVAFLHPLTVMTTAGRKLRCLSRDVSLEGLRLLGGEQLTGQTVRVMIQPGKEGTPWCFALQVLWSSVVGDGLVDSGGRLLAVADLEAQ